MPNKAWTVSLEGGQHRVEFSRNDFTGKRLIKVDGMEVYNQRSGMEVGSELPFYINVHPCAVICKTNGFTSTFDLKTDYIAAPPKIMPMWAWSFVIACAMIPILTLGGAIPAAIGAGGAVGCYWVAKATEWDTSTKVWTCVKITALTWIVFIVFASLIVQLLRGR